MMRQTLDAGLPELGLDLPESARQTLCDFGAAVIKQNEVMNLTAITQPDQVAKLHLLDSLTVLTELGIGEALVGTLEDKGTPAMVQRVAIAPPQSRIGPLSETERQALLRQSALLGRYEKPIDRESAYERLTARAQQAEATESTPAESGNDLGSMAGELLGGFAGQVMKTAMRQAANQLGRQLVRGVLGSLLGGKRR